MEKNAEQTQNINEISTEFSMLFISLWLGVTIVPTAFICSYIEEPLYQTLIFLIGIFGWLCFLYALIRASKLSVIRVPANVMLNIMIGISIRLLLHCLTHKRQKLIRLLEQEPAKPPYRTLPNLVSDERLKRLQKFGDQISWLVSIIKSTG